MASKGQKVRSGRNARPYGRWRAACLVGVHLLIGIHILHWKVNGSTLAPLELNEVMYTLELGILTAGFLLMIAAILSVFVFGRFFCSWGCHILALEDLAAWLFARMGVRPKRVRSRLLVLVPPSALFYMFVWPQLRRFIRGEPMPALHLTMDGEGWASFMTSDYWRNLPGPWIAFLTFFLCGFVIVYFLGTRSFCAYVCPYGAAFAAADRVAPGRIREPNLGDCIGCAKCTAVCSSGVRVHEEILIHGQIIDSGCLKDLDCVSVCPENAISFGFVRPKTTFVMRMSRWVRRLARVAKGMPPNVSTSDGSSAAVPLRARTGQRIVGKRYDFSWPEEILVAFAFLLATLILRGLYARVPFLLALGSAAVVSVLAVVTFRLFRDRNVRLSHLRLKRESHLSASGRSIVTVILAVVVFLTHSGWIRAHELLGDRAYAAMEAHVSREGTDPPAELLDSAARHGEFVRRWGLVRTPELHLKLASIYSFERPPLRAPGEFREALKSWPNDWSARMRCAAVLYRLDRVEEAKEELRRITEMEPMPVHRRSDADDAKAAAHFRLGMIAERQAEPRQAEASFLAATRIRPHGVDGYLALAGLYLESGDEAAAARIVERGLEFQPQQPQLLEWRRKILAESSGMERQRR